MSRIATFLTSMILFAVALPCFGSLAETVLYVAPEGNDGWTGRLECPNGEGTDGPLASMAEHATPYGP